MEKLAKAKKSAEAWLLAGSARYYRDEMEIACADLDAAIELNPKLPGLYTMSGQARYAMKDFAGAANLVPRQLCEPTRWILWQIAILGRCV